MFNNHGIYIQGDKKDHVKVNAHNSFKLKVTILMKVPLEI